MDLINKKYYDGLEGEPEIFLHWNIKCYLENDWSLYSEDKEIIYTQVGDNDDFDYFAQSKSEAEYFEIVDQKEKKKENIAFALFLSEEKFRYRIDVIITPELEIIISPDDGTKICGEYLGNSVTIDLGFNCACNR